jgi:two-component system chemotaxis response regulator CheB
MTSGSPIRVLVVDDSAFARKVLRETLSRSPLLEVVGIARDGLEALEKIAELGPDVVTLDLVMPNLDGLGVLRALPAEGGPRVVIVSISDGESALGIEALQSGAVDIVQKPTALATERLYDLSDELVAKVVAAAAAHPHPSTAAPAPPLVRLAPTASAVRLVVVGTSTGGPAALTRLLAAFPADFPAAVAVALHIPAGYTETLAHRLDETCPMRVIEAFDGAELLPGTVTLARGGQHLRVRSAGGRITAHVSSEPLTAPFCPSVDLLFRSAATLGPAVLGVVLTGMGNDGVAGATAIRQTGGRVVTEAEESCVVYGMPRAVVEANQSDGQAPIDAMAAEISRRL